MKQENRFSRPSLVAFMGLAGFLAGAVLLFFAPAALGILPLATSDSLVKLPALLGGDLSFLSFWFALWTVIGILTGLAMMRHRAHAPLSALRSEGAGFRGERSFTLIELLIVIAIIAVLATVVILVLNPAEMLRQSRDSNRLSDMKTLEQAIQLYSEDVGGTLGASSTLYISVPDTLATTSLGDACQGLGLSTSSIPAGWTYHCAGPNFYKNVDGTGWIPINFRSASFGSPIGILPVDPTNTTSSGLYYTYAASGDPYELTALMEAQKYAAQEANDGGTDPAMYEAGTSFTLSPFAHGMVGDWTFDEGSGAIAHDSSGMGNNGTWYGTGIHYAPGKVGPYAGEFNGSSTDDYILIPTITLNQFTITLWENNSIGVADNLANGTRQRTVSPAELDYGTIDDTLRYPCYMLSGAWGWCFGGSLSPNQWNMITYTYDTQVVRFYVNGQLVSETNPATETGSPYVNAISQSPENFGFLFYGYMDAIRAYNRALSASEIQAIYNAEQ